MTRGLRVLTGAVMSLLVTVGPVAAQDGTITVTPADDLVDGQSVDVVATTTGSDYGTLALCPADSAPQVGAATTDLISTRNVCVGLLCLHDGSTAADLADDVAGDCPVAVQPAPISSVSLDVALPRVLNDGTDCAVAECVVVFNTWTLTSAQGAVAAAVRFDDTVPPSTTPADTTTTTTTIELSAPVVTSTVAADAPASTIATEVLGAQETNDSELAVTGVDAGLLAALGLSLVVVGSGTVASSRRP